MHLPQRRKIMSDMQKVEMREKAGLILKRYIYKLVYYIVAGRPTG
jgi:hypothetical protein